MRIELSGRFKKSFRKLSSRIQNKVTERMEIFRRDCFDPRLKTHELHGKDKNIWSFSINRSYRIKFIFLDLGAVLFLEIGTHDIYN